MTLTDLIEKYSSEIEILPPNGGHYDAGQFVPNERYPETVRGAIIGTPSKKQYGPSGYFDSGTLNMFVKGPPLGDNLCVRWKGKIYTVEEYRDYNWVSGFTKYVLAEKGANEGGF